MVRLAPSGWWTFLDSLRHFDRDSHIPSCVCVFISETYLETQRQTSSRHPVSVSPSVCLFPLQPQQQWSERRLETLPSAGIVHVVTHRTFSESLSILFTSPELACRARPACVLRLSLRVMQGKWSGAERSRPAKLKPCGGQRGTAIGTSWRVLDEL